MGSYSQDDERFPLQADRVRRAKREFINKGGKDLSGLAMMLGLDPEYLKKRALDENWDDLRYQSLAKTPSKRLATFEKQMNREEDPLAKHAMVADFLVSLSFELAKALSSPDLKESDMRFLRSRVESARSLAEAAQSAVDIARKVRGIADGLPSTGRVEEGTHVEYEVSVKTA